MSSTEEFAQALQDLLWQRQKLQAELTLEMDRAEKLAAATRSLKEMNDQAQSIVAGTLQRIGVWDYGLPGPSNPAEIAPRFGGEAIRQAVSGSFGVN
jgi:hypothetical protein